MITKQQLDTLQALYNSDSQLYTGIYNKYVHRHPDIEQQYSLHKSNLQMLGMSTEQYLYNYLGVNKDDTFIKVTPNAYPYHLPEGYKHDLIWVSDNMSKLGIIYNIAGEYLNYTNFYLWQAPEASRSVKGIQHFHLIYKV